MSNAKIPSDAADCCAQDRDLTSTLPHLAVTTFFSCQPTFSLQRQPHKREALAAADTPRFERVFAGEVIEPRPAGIDHALHARADGSARRH